LLWPLTAPPAANCWCRVSIKYAKRCGREAVLTALKQQVILPTVAVGCGL
jgi:hypothetical protein